MSCRISLHIFHFRFKVSERQQSRPPNLREQLTTVSQRSAVFTEPLPLVGDHIQTLFRGVHVKKKKLPSSKTGEKKSSGKRRCFTLKFYCMSFLLLYVFKNTLVLYFPTLCALWIPQHVGQYLLLLNVINKKIWFDWKLFVPIRKQKEEPKLTWLISHNWPKHW